jgi:hypothetical protein
MARPGSGLLVAGVLALSACADDEPETALGIPCDVAQVLATKCERCHSAEPEFAAPYEFSTIEHFHAVHHDRPLYERVVLVVETGFMPPLALQADPPVEPLTPAEEEILLEWTRAGAPAREREGCGPE